MSTWRWNEFVNKLTVFLTDEAVNKAKDTKLLQCITLITFYSDFKKLVWVNL